MWFVWWACLIKMLQLKLHQNTVMNFFNIKEIVDAVIQMLESKCINEIFNICTGTGSTVHEICNFFKDKFPDQFELKFSDKILKDVSSSILCVKKLDHRIVHIKLHQVFDLIVLIAKM